MTAVSTVTAVKPSHVTFSTVGVCQPRAPTLLPPWALFARLMIPQITKADYPSLLKQFEAEGKDLPVYIPAGGEASTALHALAPRLLFDNAAVTAAVNDATLGVNSSDRLINAIAQRIDLLMKIVRIFSFYKESEKGHLVVKHTNEPTGITSHYLATVLERAFQLQTAHKGRLKKDGNLEEFSTSNLPPVVYKMEDDGMHMLLESRNQVDYGFNGIVYRALDIALGIFVAVKKATNTHNKDAFKQMRFEKCFLSAINLNHHYRHFQPTPLVTFKIASPLANGYATEFLGRFESIVANASVGIDQRINMCEQMITIAIHLHANNLVHRDIKVANFCYRGAMASPELVLIDWSCADSDTLSFFEEFPLVPAEGYASSIDHQACLNMMNCHTTLPRHKIVKQSLDIFGLGITLYQTLAGCPPQTEAEIKAGDAPNFPLPYEEFDKNGYVQVGATFLEQPLLDKKIHPKYIKLIKFMTSPRPKHRPSFKDVLARWQTITKSLEAEKKAAKKA